MTLKAFTHAQELAYLKVRLRILVDRWDKFNSEIIRFTQYEEGEDDTLKHCAREIQDLLDTIDKMDYEINRIGSNE